MSQISTTFPDSTYTSSNKPSADTLKADIAAIETGANETDTYSVRSDGTVAFTANQSLGTKKLTNVGAGTSATDASTIGGTETLTNKTLTSPTLNTPTFSAGAVDTADLADNSATEASMVTGAADITVTQTESDMDDMTITRTTEGGDVLCTFNAPVRNGTLGATTTFYINVDDTNKIGTIINHPVANYNFPVTLSWIEPGSGLESGSHTFKVRWVAGTGTSSQLASNGIAYRRSFSVIEFKK